jgi:hypothetical protein
MSIENVSAGLNCQAAFAALGKDNGECAKIAAGMLKHPRLAAIVEHACLYSYEQANGEIVGAIDWMAILKWVMANGPAILAGLLQLFAFFGI